MYPGLPRAGGVHKGRTFPSLTAARDRQPSPAETCFLFRREQWNDGSNTLAIAPGEVVVYARNAVTNRALEEAGIRLHTIPSAELSRGRGGPRCMSMPLWREDP